MTGTAAVPSPSASSSRSATPPTVALALGGGGARGLAHIHIIEAFDTLGLRPVAIAGSSIGAIMGAAMAAGLSGAEIRDHTLATVGRRAEVLNRIWSLRPATLADAFGNGLRVGQFNLERILRAFLPPGLPERIEELEVPTKIVTSDFYAQRECVCEDGDLFRALAASAALPAVFMPVMIEGRVMIDGGLSNPVPFDHLRGLADIVVGVDVIGKPEGDETAMPNRIDSLFGASQLTMHAIVEGKRAAGAPDIFLRPDVGRFRVLDFLRAKEILAATAGVRDALLRALEERLSRPGI
ncbi:patatin-like phospholipase family protein [Rhizobium sp. TRM95111]|uniref:patatin-like phospholipase family protein n=1 Tax=Rhizobium alarense TaxID=2846851 RepID=UPI001F32328A|nr:patatin-like phospholipase family protein [Rhizobium alarense]MCF3641453.1 patatin-like phospholipase family protein [Rhizobium alarense]